MVLDGLEKDGDIEAYVIEATPESGRPVTFHFGKSSGLLVRIDSVVVSQEGLWPHEAQYPHPGGVKPWVKPPGMSLFPRSAERGPIEAHCEGGDDCLGFIIVSPSTERAPIEAPAPTAPPIERGLRPVDGYLGRGNRRCHFVRRRIGFGYWLTGFAPLALHLAYLALHLLGRMIRPVVCCAMKTIRNTAARITAVI